MDTWLDRLRREIEETTQGLSDSDWSRAPQGRWNSAQILEHLGRSYGGTAKALELSLAAGSPPQMRTAKISERMMKFLIVNLGIFPSGGKAPAFVAPQGEAGPVALKRALSGLERMKVATAAAEERWGSTAPVAMHFVLGPLSPGQWRKFHYVHGHHHVLQMRKRLGDQADGAWRVRADGRPSGR
jgi:DinB superfamily